MKKQTLRFFAFFAAVLMLVSILPAGALAASDNGQNTDNGQSRDNGNADDSDDSDDSSDDSTDSEDNTSDDVPDDSEEDNEPPGIQKHDRDRDMVNADEDSPRKMLANKVQKIRNSKDDYQAAKTNFASIKSKNPSLNSEEAISATREYLNVTIDYMISVLDNDDYIAELEEVRENVEDASTRKELADSAKDIRSIWNDARKDRVSSAGKAINNKINAVIKASDSLTLRLENEIATMKENGEDVEDLEKMLEEYKEQIADAKGNQEHARNTYMNGSASYGENVREANRYLNQAGKDIKDSNAILREMLQALKQQREGVIVLNGDGELNAEGNGTAVISGDAYIELTVTDAKLVIKDMAGDADIDTTDAEYETSNVDSGNSTDNNRAFVYLNITGNVIIDGSRLTVMVRGDDINLAADGTGTAVLAGTGSYTVKDGESGEWASRYIDASSDIEDESEVETTSDDVEDEIEEESDESSEEDENEEDTSANSEEEGTSEDGNETAF